jgi:hypothetical protein
MRVLMVGFFCIVHVLLLISERYYCIAVEDICRDPRKLTSQMKSLDLYSDYAISVIWV